MVRAVAHRGAQHRHHRGSLGRRALADAPLHLGHVNLVMKRDQCSVRGTVGEKNRTEVLIRCTGPIERPIHGIAANNLLERGMVFLAVRQGVDRCACVGLRVLHVT